MRGVLGETARLLAANLHLFTLVALTVWLPGHLALNYLEFFGPPDDQSHQPLRLGFVLQAFFDPLVVAAVISALARIKSGLPATYGEVLLEGLPVGHRHAVLDARQRGQQRAHHERIEHHLRGEDDA